MSNQTPMAASFISNLFTDSNNLEVSRQRILQNLLVATSVLGTIQIGLSIVQNIINSTSGDIDTLDLLTLVSIVGFFWAVALARRTPYHIRAYIFVGVYLLGGIRVLTNTGLLGHGRLILAIFPIICLFLLGKRAGWVSLVLCIGLVTTVGILEWQGTQFIETENALVSMVIGERWISFSFIMTLIAYIMIQIFQQTDADVDEAFNREQSLVRTLREEGLLLERRVAARTRALEASAAISQRISDILDEEVVIENILDEIQQNFRYDYVQVYLFDQNDTLSLVRGGGRLGQDLMPSNTVVKRMEGMIGTAAVTGESILAADVANDDNWVFNQHLAKTKAEISVPIKIENNVLGILDIQQSTANGLDQDDVYLLEIIAGQLAVALRNARTYLRTRQREAYETKLNQITQELNQADSIEEVLKLAAEELSKQLNLSLTKVQLGLPRKGNTQR